MRKRVALRGARLTRTVVGKTARALALVALPVMLLVATANTAAAQQSQNVEARIPFSIAGPVGLATIAVGLGGLVLGLFRQRRKIAVVKAGVMETAVVEAAVMKETVQAAEPVTPGAAAARTAPNTPVA